MGAFFGGKVLALAATFASVGAAGIVLGRTRLGIEMHNATFAILWITCGGVALYLLTVLFQLSSSEQRAGMMLNAFFLFLFAMLGGSFFPFEMMPAWLASIGRYMPNGWLIQHFKEIVGGKASNGQLLRAFAVVNAWSGLALWYICRRLRTWGVS